MDSTKNYLEECEVIDLIKKAQKGDTSAVEKLFFNFEGFINFSLDALFNGMAVKPKKEEYMGRAYIPFSKAVMNFDVNRENNVLFSTYLRSYFLEVKEEWRKENELISIPKDEYYDAVKSGDGETLSVLNVDSLDKNIETDDDEMSFDFADESANVEDKVIASHIMKAFSDKVADLPKDLAIIVIAKICDGASFEAIGKKLGKSTSTVQMQYSKALELLRRDVKFCQLLLG